MRAIFAILVLVCVFSASGVHAESAPRSAEQEAERMLAVLGGRDAWAKARNSINVSQQNRAEDPAVVVSTISLDFETMRFRIETVAPDFTVIRAVDGDTHWRKRRDGTIEGIPEDTLAEDRLWYGAHVYRSIHRLAARDPRLSVTLREDGRLQVLEDGKNLIWFRLDPRGEPYAFGQWEDEIGSICGPWEAESAGIRHPVWTASSDGAWRAMLKSLTVNATFAPELFAKPGS